MQQDRDLRELARVLQQPPAESQWAAATTLVILLVDDPSTHWVLTQVRQPCCGPAKQVQWQERCPFTRGWHVALSARSPGTRAVQ